MFLRLFLQNVAVSKSRHRLLFYPTRKGKKHRKIPFSRYFSGLGGRLKKGKVLAPFLSVVIHGLLGTWSIVIKIAFFVLVGLIKFFVLKTSI